MKNSALRKLAYSDYWIQMYRASKEHNINLFVNDSNLGHLQIVLLSYLSCYDDIYTSIASDMLDGAVMDLERMKSDFLVDCYLIYKRRKNNKKDNINNNKKQNLSGIPSISFVSGKKRR